MHMCVSAAFIYAPCAINPCLEINIEIPFVCSSVNRCYTHMHSHYMHLVYINNGQRETDWT